MIENLVERRRRPDVMVCSLGFDQFNPKLSQAVNIVDSLGEFWVELVKPQRANHYIRSSMPLQSEKCRYHSRFSQQETLVSVAAIRSATLAGLGTFSASEPTRGTVHLTASALWVVKSTSSPQENS